MAAAPIYTLTYNNLNGPPLRGNPPVGGYSAGTDIVIPANLRKTFDATATNEIGGILTFSKDPSSSTLLINGAFIITGDAAGVNWMPIITSFKHNSYMIFHTHPPRSPADGFRYNGYSSTDLSIFLRFILSTRRNPHVSIHYALFTPTDIHFTFIDEVCFKLLKFFIKKIRDEIFAQAVLPGSPAGTPPRQGSVLVQTQNPGVNIQHYFNNYSDFTNAINVFLLILLDQILIHFVDLSRRGMSDADITTLFDTISLMPIHTSPSYREFYNALGPFRQCIVTRDFTTFRIIDIQLKFLVERDASPGPNNGRLFQQLGIIGTVYFNLPINPNQLIIRTPTMDFTPAEKIIIMNNLGLFKTSSLSRAGIPPNTDILITCIDNSKIYNETIGWPAGPVPDVLMPTLSSPIILQDGGAFQKGGAITSGAIVKINNKKISMITPIGSIKLRSKRRLFKIPSIRHTTKRSVRHTARNTTRHK